MLDTWRRVRRGPFYKKGLPDSFLFQIKPMRGRGCGRAGFMIEEMPERGRFIEYVPLVVLPRRSGMKLVLLTCLAVAVFACCVSTAQAQAVQPPDSRSSDQWVSHQMNQPLPGTGDKYSVSQDRLDDIQQLYLQAKKEMDAKADTKPRDKK